MRQYSVACLNDSDFSSDLARAQSPILLPSESGWASLPAAPIDCYLASPNEYRPKAEAQLARDDQALYLRLRVCEKNPLITWCRHQDPVYQDSCLEFFVMSNPSHSARYINFEFNATGTVLSAYGEGRKDRIALTAEDLSDLMIKVGILADPRPAWQVSCRIPRIILEKYCGLIDWRSGHVMTGNFYKCGDQTAEPHYGCWNLVAKPDFHRPEDFGRLVFA